MRSSKPYAVDPRITAGFTLLELMVVLLIIGISASLVLPHLGRSLPGARLKAGARQIAAALRYARSQAVSLRIPYGVHVSSDRRTIAVLPWNVNAAEQPEPRKSASTAYRLPEGVLLEVVTADPLQAAADQTIIVFYITGACSGGRIRLSDRQNRRYSVQVQAINGRVSIEKV